MDVIHGCHSFIHSNTIEGHYKPRLYVPVKLLAEVWPPPYTTVLPMGNTARLDNHKKINSWLNGFMV